MSTSMETPYLHDPLFAPPPPYSIHSDQYLATAGDLEFAANFSLGSSLAYPDPHEGYPFVFHRGEGSSYRASAVGLGATGLGFSDNNTPSLASSLFPNEEVPLYPQPWNWAQQAQASTLHGVVAPVPVLPGPPEVSFLPLKNKQVASSSSYERSPDPPLPTPAAMAVLLSSGARADNRGPFDLVEGVAAASIRDGALGPASVGAPANHSALETASREKKHACTMCHKRFDRPSTLRKHLLVHTGEKAFVCDICGRRFGVNSNLNRHVKRCALKPVNMAISSPPKSSSDSPSSCDETSGHASPVAQSPENSFARSPTIPHKRGSISSVSSSSSCTRGRSSMSPLQSQHSIPTNAGSRPTQKRRRRAPSPSRWVPLSLRSFNLVSEDMYRSVSVPLAPVRRNLPKEERDSWDENIAPTPYHPEAWKGVLPGPGLPTHHGLRNRDMMKMHYGGGSGTFMVGRLLAV